MPEPTTVRWEDVAEDLAHRIRAGEFPIGTALPSTARLMTQHNAKSNGPIKKAIDALRMGGVVEGRQGAAVYVRRIPGPDEAFSYPRTLAERVAELEAWRKDHERDHA